MHSALLAAQSPVLDSLVNGGMKEAKELTATWEHVQEHTFVHFSQFAYSGDFTIHDPDKTSEDGGAVDEAVKCETLGQRLLQHAELMVFAESYAMDGLLALASSKLEGVLSDVKIDKEPTSQQAIYAVACLAKYCFEEQQPEIVRKAVVPTLKRHGPVLWGDDCFQGVVKDLHSLSIVFIDCILQQSRPPSFLVDSTTQMRCVTETCSRFNQRYAFTNSVTCGLCRRYCELCSSAA